MKKILALVMRLLAVILIPVLMSCNSESNKPVGQTLAEVDVALPVKKNIVEWDEYTGRFQAVEEVDVRARVTGYLEAIKFQDGQTVKKETFYSLLINAPSNMLWQEQKLNMP
ncbi:hypothetical protein PGH45_06135 [Legionella pneumophila]|nr:hypothetical protein [Legionella pneumophila]